MQIKVNNVSIECVKGDIASQPDITAIVNATTVALSTIHSLLPDLNHLKTIRFVLFSQNDYEVYESKIKLMFSKK